MYGVYLAGPSGIISSSLPLSATAAGVTASSADQQSSSKSAEEEGSSGGGGGGGGGGGENGKVFNHYAGYLLRVKPAVSNEGGVAAGYSVLSAPSLQ